MMTRLTKIAICAACTLFFGALQTIRAQEFKWGLRFDTRFDNREFDNVKRQDTVSSQTFFSVRLAPVVGIGWNERHSIMAGGTFTFDMGASLDKHDPDLLLYYNYDSPKYKVYAGKFERRHLIGSYSRAIYAGGSTFYDNVIDGLALQYTPNTSKLELVLDWDGMQSLERRESFRILSAGEYNPVAYKWRWFTGGYSLDMYHLASSADVNEGVVEHFLVNPWVGAAFERFGIWFDKLSLHAGWMNSFDRERKGENKWKTPGGVTVDFTMEKRNVGIRSRFYFGDEQFPFWGTYGSRIYKGDPFHMVSDFYNFTQIYWRPRLTDGVRLDVEIGLHFDGSSVGLQQVAWLGVSLDSGMFGKNRTSKKRVR